MTQKQGDFTIRAYGRTELAEMYLPHLSPNRAWRKLQDWIGVAQGLEQRLAQLGYRKSQRMWTPRQVRAIVEALGEP